MSGPTRGSREFLDAALGIARTLCAAAWWDDEGRECNWLGRADREGIVPGSITPAIGALEADLYRGSTGVALFLTEIAGETGDVECRRTALGGLRRSIRILLGRPLERASPLSFFLGHLGAAWVAHRAIATAPPALDDAPDLEEGYERLLAAARAAFSEPHPLDLLGGNAGAIPALLCLAHRGPESGRTVARDLALDCGLELARLAVHNGPFAVWPGATVAGPAAAPGSSESPLLTGLSHGASGLALALLEIHAETGETTPRDLARGTFAYEDQFWSAADGNWRDAREAMAAGGYQTAWCHGAPGIALARLRAMALDSERAEAHAATARLALATTRSALERNLAGPRQDATLCHGLTGLAEILALGAARLGDADLRAVAENSARELIRRHAGRGDWPSGVPSGGWSPALMLGTAGIGLHFLRLYAPDRVPTVLLAGG